MLLDHALTGYWLARRRDFSPNTIRDYSLTFARFTAFFGPNSDLDAITAADLHRFLNHLVRKYRLGDKTLANAWIALSSLYSWAAVELALPHPMRDKKVPCPRSRRPEITPYSEAEVKAMLHACERTAGWDRNAGRRTTKARPEALRDKTLLVTLLDTGLRASELCDLKLADYNQSDGALLIRHGKGDKRRTVYLGSAGRRHLWKYLASRAAATQGSPLFATREETHILRQGLYTLVERIGARAGVANPTVHRFRHTFAINFLRNGGNMLELQRMLGHESLETIKIYVRLAHSDLAAAVRTASPADRWNL